MSQHNQAVIRSRGATKPEVNSLEKAGDRDALQVAATSSKTPLPVQEEALAAVGRIFESTTAASKFMISANWAKVTAVLTNGTEPSAPLTFGN